MFRGSQFRRDALPAVGDKILKRPLVTALAGMTIGCSDPRRFVSFLAEVWDWEVLVEGAEVPVNSARRALASTIPICDNKRALIVSAD